MRIYQRMLAASATWLTLPASALVSFLLPLAQVTGEEGISLEDYVYDAYIRRIEDLTTTGEPQPAASQTAPSEVRRF